MSWNNHDPHIFPSRVDMIDHESLARQKALADAEERVRARRPDAIPLDTATRPASRPTLKEMEQELRRLAGEAFAAGEDARAKILRDVANHIAECGAPS